MSDEMLDLVSINDTVIGQLPRSKVYAQNISNFRVINAFVINNKGQLWIPRRTKTKQIFPLCLDVSVGGHVKSGETYDQAFKRELTEEICLDADRIPYKMIGKLNPYEHNTSAFMHVYLIRLNHIERYNTQDFFEYYWLSPQECIKKIQSGDNAKTDLIKIIQHLLL